MEEFRIAHQKMFGRQNRQHPHHNRLNEQQGDVHDNVDDDVGQDVKDCIDKNDKHKDVEDQHYRLSSINNNKNNIDDHKSSLKLSNHHNHQDNDNDSLDNMIPVESSLNKLNSNSSITNTISAPTITTLLNVFPRRNFPNQTMSNQHVKQIPSSSSSSLSTLKSTSSSSPSNDRPILSSFSTTKTNTSTINNNISKNRSVEMDHSISLSAAKFVLKKSIIKLILYLY